MTSTISGELFAKCRAFVQEQSGGEWDDKTVDQDGMALAQFVKSQIDEATATPKTSADQVALYANPVVAAVREAYEGCSNKLKNLNVSDSYQKGCFDTGTLACHLIAEILIDLNICDPVTLDETS